METELKSYNLIALLIAGGFLVALASPHLHAEANKDTREVLKLTSQQNASVRYEMRRLLASVADIVTALDNNDFKAIEQAARKSGMAMAAQVEVTLKERLPMQFKKFGKAVHVGFDEIADAALAEGANKDKMISLLGKQLQRCIACHATYRLE